MSEAGKEYKITSPKGKEMLGNAPGCYAESFLFKALMQAEGLEFDKYRTAITGVLNQFFVNTATWGLDTWEDELGITRGTGMTDQERRERIRARLRGQGTATIHLIKTVAEAYDNGAVQIIEDHTAYTIHVKFVDTRGVPTDLDSIKAAIREVVPANMEIKYTYRYTVWADMESVTWEDVEAADITWAEIPTWTPVAH